MEHTEITAGAWHLRPPRESEAAEIAEFARTEPPMASGPSAAPGAPPPGEAEAVRWVHEAARWEGQVTFSILESTTERWSGYLTLGGLETDEPWLMCHIAPWARGNGAATTAVRCVTGWATALHGLDRLTLRHAPHDEAACHVATRTGYALTHTTDTEHVHVRTA